MKWNIICDSGCDLFELEHSFENISYASVPFFLSIEGKDFIDDEKLDVEEMVDIMKASKKASSSACPSPDAWSDKMVAGANNICVTISKNLSGSYQSAVIASEAFCQENPGTYCVVVDGCATGPASVLAVRKLTEQIEKGEEIETVVKNTEEYISGIDTVFALSCFDNLVKAGRVGKIAGILAASLDFWGVGVEKEGTIAFRTKVRGKKKAIAAMLEAIEENGFNDGNIVISHCLNEPLALKMKEEFEKLGENINVTILKTRGLNSFYADKAGIIISY